MKRFLLILQTVACGIAILLTAGCASDDDTNNTVPPSDNLSGLPWNRPLPGEAGQRFGGFPQSH